MNPKRLILGTEIVICAALFTFIGYGMYLGHFVSLEAFLGYVKEDGLVEYLTAFFLFLCSLVCLYRIFHYLKMRKPFWIITWAFLAILFFFAAGEEISWGQRILGIESGDFFQQHNKQAETNFHNLVVKGHNLNIVLFSRLMFLVLITYFIFSRLMFWKITFIYNLVNKFRIPLPKIHHIIIMVAATLMILLIHLVKESELHELSFSMVFFMIFINPYNNRYQTPGRI